jgi:hypothetical protein
MPPVPPFVLAFQDGILLSQENIAIPFGHGSTIRDIEQFSHDGKSVRDDRR